MKRHLLLSVALATVLLPVSTTAQDASNRFWSLATTAVTAPSGETLYHDYKQLQAFEQQLTRMPWEEDVGDGVLEKPWLRPEQTTDALLETAGLMDYIATRTAQDLGVFSDRLIGSHAQGYGSGARDSDRATLGVEIGAASVSLVETTLRTSAGDPTAIIGEFRDRAESGVKLWLAGALRDNVLAPETLRAFSDGVTQESLDALNSAQEEQLRKGEEFLQRMWLLERGVENPDDGVATENPDLASFMQDIRNVSDEDDLDEIGRKIASGEYSEAPEGNVDFQELLDSAKEYVAGAKSVTDKANDVAELLDAAGVDLPEEVTDALNFANFATGAASQFVSGDFIGAATSVFKFFGPKKPSAEQLRHQAIMGALTRIDRKLDKVLANQAQLIEGQRQIMEQLDRMEWTIEAGFQNLETSLQESTTLILRAIFARDERGLAVCRSTADAINPILFPESAESIDLFKEPNRSGPSATIRDEWITDPPHISVKLNYIAGRYGRDLDRCFVELSDLFNSLQGGRPIDEYFFLNRLADGELDSQLKQQGEELAANSSPSDLARPQKFAASFRDNLFYPVVKDYYLPRMADVLQNEQGLSPTDAQRTAIALAFSPPHFTQASATEGNTNPEASAPQRSRLVGDHAENVVKIERYFTEKIYDEIERPLSAPSVLYAAGSVRDLHSVFGLMGRSAQEFAMDVDGYVGGRVAHGEEEALRLLMQALQMVELLRAQQAMIDGTSLVELLWRDIYALNEARWQEAQSNTLSRSSLIRDNFARYALFRAATENTRSSPTQYRVVLMGGNRRAVEAYLDSSFGADLIVEIECLMASDDPRFCDAISGNRYETNFVMKIRWLGDPADGPARFAARLPGFLALESRSYLRSETFENVRDEYDRLRAEVASYQMEEAIVDALKDEELQPLVQSMISLYQYSKNAERGFQRPLRPIVAVSEN
ncbi:MAG: hypothetical protein ABJ251_18035 [Paracoccaceae bacterium]